MKKIAWTALVAGILLAAAAYITEINDLPGAVELRTFGFIGYILIISAVAWFLLRRLYEWDKKTEAPRA
ncbi:hypothetical protein [Chitinophaga varians]|uniref:hypothetical protein n=1 Tax=Chitinophaga varians TaxID=2202339 RepID=UPI00165FC2B1|nr:hypothetical protein [Chitinophaga varians]MBC9915481.1 hypothetical protein [Chitinophaga varians]